MKKLTNAMKLKQKYLGAYSRLVQVVKRQPALSAVITSVLLVLVAAVIWQAPWSTAPDAGQAAKQHKAQLETQVDTETGAPRSGRDPASQPQTSLADAASKPTGAGTRNDTPAAGVQDEPPAASHDHSHMHGMH